MDLSALAQPSPHSPCRVLWLSVCMDCRQVYGSKFGEVGVGLEITHGICDGCDRAREREAFLADLAERWAA